jgi:predicted phosphodiesterase
MKIALLADIHGNAHALETVLEDVRKRGADKILVLGDIVFKGPLPEKCVQIVRDLDTVVLQGNIDELVGQNMIQDGFAKSEEHAAALRKEMDWNRERLSASDLDYLAGLPMEHKEELSAHLSLRCVHAAPGSLLDFVLPTDGEDKLLPMFEGGAARKQIVGYAHIHQPYVRFFQGKTIFNTGSVGLSFDGDPRASYVLLETDGDDYAVSIRRVRYDIEAAVQAFSGSGHPFAQSVIDAIRAGRRPV